MWSVVAFGLLAQVLLLLSLSRLRILYRASPCSPSLITSFARRSLLKPQLSAHLSLASSTWELAPLFVADNASLSDRNLWWMGWNQVLAARRGLAEGCPKVIWFMTLLGLSLNVIERLQSAATSVPLGDQVNLRALLLLAVGAPSAIACHWVALRARREAQELKAALRAFSGAERGARRG